MVQKTVESKAYKSTFLKNPSSITAYVADLLYINYEFLKAFFLFKNVSPLVTVFGSARVKKDSNYYRQAVEIGEILAKNDLAVLTGGGPGLMEAANKGASRHTNDSYGCNIWLFHEQRPNDYLHKWMDFGHFFSRKMSMIKFSKAFVILPGGFGTLDELAEILILKVTNKIDNVPIIVVGKEFWESVFTFFKKKMLEESMISESDLDNVYLIDSNDELIEILKNNNLIKKD